MATAPSSHQKNARDDELDADEPHTPLWLTLLGIGLFLLAGIYFVVSKPEPPSNAVTAEQSEGGANDEAPAEQPPAAGQPPSPAR